jgi:uncharacterized protein (DUF3084 family)
MQLEPKEVLDYIEASNNVIDAQKAELEKLEKSASEKDTLLSEKDAKIQELEQKLSENEEKVAQAKVAEQDSNSAPSWGTGEQKEVQTSKLRDSERALYERFGIPIN